jgi:hypothetical protein
MTLFGDVKPKSRDGIQGLIDLTCAPADVSPQQHKFETMTTSDLIGFDSFTLKGDSLTRAVAALRVARQQVRLALADTDSWRVEAALSEIEDEIGVHLSRIEAAVDDDAADREESGEAATRRQAWLPLRAA